LGDDKLPTDEYWVMISNRQINIGWW